MKIIIVLCVTMLCIESRIRRGNDDPFSSEEYYKKLASQKLELLKNEIYSNTQNQGFYDIFTSLKLLFQSNMPTFSHIGDGLPPGRKKLTHSEGVAATCEIEFFKDSNKYTGLFSEVKLKNAIIRFSTAKNYSTWLWKKNAKNAYDNFVPGVAIKVLIDGRHSINTQCMSCSMGQTSYNFFKETFTTSFDIGENESFVINKLGERFSEVSKYVTSIGFKEWSQYKSDGSQVKGEISYPFRLDFIANEDVKKMFKDDYSEANDFKTILKSLEPGTPIFTIFAIDKPGCAPVKIGSITLSSTPTTSKFGDRNLFFRHSKVEDDDVNSHSNFGKYRDSFETTRIGKENPQGIYKCPFLSNKKFK